MMKTKLPFLGHGNSIYLPYNLSHKNTQNIAGKQQHRKWLNKLLLKLSFPQSLKRLFFTLGKRETSPTTRCIFEKKREWDWWAKGDLEHVRTVRRWQKFPTAKIRMDHLQGRQCDLRRSTALRSTYKSSDFDLFLSDFVVVFLGDCGTRNKVRIVFLLQLHLKAVCLDWAFACRGEIKLGCFLCLGPQETEERKSKQLVCLWPPRAQGSPFQKYYSENKVVFVFPFLRSPLPPQFSHPLNFTAMNPP